MLRYLGFLLGAISLFNLTNGYLDFGLSWLFAEVMRWYAAVFHPIVGVLEPLGLKIAAYFARPLPENWEDMVVLYTLAGTATYRTFNVDGADSLFVRAISLVVTVAWPIFLFLWSITGLFTGEGLETILRWSTEVSKVVMLFLIFLLINSGLAA